MGYNFNGEPELGITVSSKDNCTYVNKGNKLSPSQTVDFKIEEVYDKGTQNDIHEEIFKRYKEKDSSLDEEFLEEIKEKIDPSIYKALEAYDKNNRVTNKRDEYVSVMLKHYRRHAGETLNDYETRVAENKKELLKIHDLEVSYDTTLFGNRSVSHYAKAFDGKTSIHGSTAPVRNLHFSRVGNKDDLNIKTKDAEATKSELNNIQDGLKEDQRGMFSFIKRKPSKENIKVDGAKKGFMQKLKDWKEKNPDKFKKYTIRGSIVALIAAISVTGAVTANRNKDNITIYPNEPGTTVESEYNDKTVGLKTDNEEDLENSDEAVFDDLEDSSFEDELDENIIINNDTKEDTTAEIEDDEIEDFVEDQNDEIDTQYVDIDSQEDEILEEDNEQDNSVSKIIVDNVEPDTDIQDNIASSITIEDFDDQVDGTQNTEYVELDDKENVSEEKTVTSNKLAKALFANSNLNMDDLYHISDGKYYETPEGTGRSGSYNNTDAKITYVNILKDGIFYEKYDPNSGESLQDFIKRYLDDESYSLSFHFINSDGMILGWDNSEKTQKALLKTCMQKENMSSELKEKILNTIDQEKVKESDLNDILNELNNLNKEKDEKEP